MLFLPLKPCTTSNIAAMYFLLCGIAFDEVANLTSPCWPATQNKLSLSHALLLSFPSSIMQTASYILCSLSLNKDRSKFVSNEEDVISNLQLANNCKEFDEGQISKITRRHMKLHFNFLPYGTPRMSN